MGEVTVLWFPPRALLFCRECSTGRLCSLKSALWKELLGGSYKEECRMLPFPSLLLSAKQDPLGQGLSLSLDTCIQAAPDAKERRPKTLLKIKTKKEVYLFLFVSITNYHKVSSLMQHK